MSQMTSTPLEVWAGFECTLNRVGDVQHDQLALTGHYARADADLDALAALGVRTVRYPILWERIEGGVPNGAAWEWTDARMARLRVLGIDPIVGLVHHGSGPFGTDLLDSSFPERLAGFARRVAERYPWVRRFTPVNEPLTTARFSALYGLWHPHARDDASFLRATLNQVRAIRLAMEAIRRVTPDAQLVQTEDLGRTHATELLQYQADFENERRWLTVDLLTRRVDDAHPVRGYLEWAGISRDEIEEAMGSGCIPDIVGINHYATSERWLDERLDRYPAHAHGGNHRHRYADVEAVRARPEGAAGPARLLLEAWQRYRLPIAVTEAHLGCTREQQLRWLHEVWEGAHVAREAGADVRAVTAWAALGTRDWSSLVTRLDGDYEPGLFDIRAPTPRSTALARMVRALAATGSYDHGALGAPGWWRSPERIAFVVDRAVAPTHPPTRARTAATDRPLLVTGAAGTLGSAFVRLCRERGLSCVGRGHHDLDATDRNAVERAVRETGAWAVINAAGYVRVDDAERDAAACHRANVAVPATLAAACAEQEIPLLTFSSDLVFDGEKRAPYVESDAPRPSGIYGITKADAERRVLAVLPSALVVRAAWFFGPWDAWNVVTASLRKAAEGQVVELPDDQLVSPTYVPDLVHTALDLLIDGERGIWHLASAGATTPLELVKAACRLLDLDDSLITARRASYPGMATRPAQSVLESERASIMPSLEHALIRYSHATRSEYHGADSYVRAAH